MFLTSEGEGRQQSFTQAAPNELKLGEGGWSGESWPSAWWRRGVRRRQGKNNDEAGIRAVVELQPDFSTIPSLVENMDIYMVTKCTNAYYFYHHTYTRVAH